MLLGSRGSIPVQHAQNWGQLFPWEGKLLHSLMFYSYQKYFVCSAQPSAERTASDLQAHELGAGEALVLLAFA